MKTLGLFLLAYIVLPTILAAALWATGVGIAIQAFFIGICYAFLSGKTAIAVGTFMYWLIFLILMIIALRTPAVTKK